MRITTLTFYTVALLNICLTCCMDDDINRRRRGRAVRYDTCSSDCSQTIPRIRGDNTVFNCTVGNLKEVKQFRATHKKEMERSELTFGPPKLLGIDFYRKRYTDSHLEGALNITFQLPKVSGKQYPIAVFLHFQSVDAPDYKNDYYYENPRERIFQFLNYKPDTYYDSENPRNISYKCMVGLTNDKSLVAYMITLETAFGGKVTYNCTIHAHQGNDAGFPIEWLPAIATYLNTTGKTVEVVFEEYLDSGQPDDVVNVFYNVSLLAQNKTILDYKKVNTGKHQTSFKDIKHGKYFIKVSICKENTFDILYGGTSGKNCEFAATSYIIDATSIPEKETPITYTEKQDTMYLVLAVTLGCIIGVTLVGSLIFLKAHKKAPSRSTSFEGGKTPTGLILYRSSVRRPVIEKFAMFLQRVCDCSVHVDIFETDRAKLMEPEKWCDDRLETVSFVIIVCSAEPTSVESNILPTQTDICYKRAIEKAVSKKKNSNDIRIIPVQFSLIPNKTIPHILDPNSCLLLMKDMDKLYGRIHVIRKIPQHLHDKVDFKTYYAKSKEGSELKLALDNIEAYLNTDTSVRSQLQLHETENKEMVEPFKSDIKEKHDAELDNKDSCVMDKLADINLSQSTIDAFSSVSSDPNRDSDAEIPEHIPLLYTLHDDIYEKPSSNQNYLRDEFRQKSNQRQIHNYEGYPQYHKRRFEDNGIRRVTNSASFQEYDSRPNPARQTPSVYHNKHHKPLADHSQFHYEHKGTDFARVHTCNEPSEFYHDFDQPYLPFHNQRVQYDIINPETANYVQNMCPYHSIIEQSNSPELDTDRNYIYSLNECLDGSRKPRFIPNPHHSFPQDPNYTYENRTRQQIYMPSNDPVKLEFQAVDPYEHEILTHRKGEDQNDSGYRSGDPSDIYKAKRNNNKALNTDTSGNSNDKLKTTEVLSYGVSTLDQEKGTDKTTSKLTDTSDQRQEERSPAVRTNSYPLSLSGKRDFNPDMFIPPDDSESESCNSDKDVGSTTDIMDQLASFNYNSLD